MMKTIVNTKANSMYKLELEVMGGEEELIELIGILGAIQYLGVKGCSRKLVLDIDGDGSAGLEFKINLGDGLKRIDDTILDTDSDSETFNFCIGE